MKILFLASWYPTSKDGYSGLFIKKHAAAVKASGNDVVVLAIVVHRSKSLWRKRVEDFYDENGIRTVSVEIDTCFRDVAYHLIPLQYHIVRSIFNKDISKTFSPDIIHSNVIFPSGIIGDKFARKLGLPHIITEHWSQLRRFLKKPLFSRMGVKAYRNAIRILPVSYFLKQEIIDSSAGRASLQNNAYSNAVISRYMPASTQTAESGTLSGCESVPTYIAGQEGPGILDVTDKFRIIGNVIDSEIFKYKAKVADKDEVRICTIGTWNRTRSTTKRPELLIEALSILQTEFDKKIRLTMVGGGERLGELKELCSSKGVVAEFTGYLAAPEVASVLHSTDYMAHCSNVETFGIVVAEALMTGTPVICSNVGALSELMSEESGVPKGITCENTLDDWLHKLRMAFQWDFDNESIAKEMGDRYGMEAISGKLGEVYSELFCQIKKMD